jgi:CDP-diacylglycerol---glycerol-3-phosphate 3-phosphatidyltransferase
MLSQSYLRELKAFHRALGDVTRLRVVQILATEGEFPVSELVLAPSPAHARGHRAHRARRSRGPLLLRPRALHGDAGARLPRAHEPRLVSIVPDRLARTTRGGIAPIARRLHAFGVSANAVTLVGFLITVAGAALLASRQPGAALLVLLLGTLSDTLDGQIARAAGGGTRFGAFLDSTLDRLSDAALAIAAVYLGAAIFEIRSVSDAASVPTGATASVLFWAGLLLLVASFLVSYIRAKAESLGEGASVGLAPREARIAIYLIGVAAWAVTGNPQLFAAAVALAAFLATMTVIQRVAHMARALDEKKG